MRRTRGPRIWNPFGVVVLAALGMPGGIVRAALPEPVPPAPSEKTTRYERLPFIRRGKYLGLPEELLRDLSRARE